MKDFGEFCLLWVFLNQSLYEVLLRRLVEKDAFSEFCCRPFWVLVVWMQCSEQWTDIEK